MIKPHRRLLLPQVHPRVRLEKCIGLTATAFLLRTSPADKYILDRIFLTNGSLPPLSLTSLLVDRLPLVVYRVLHRI